MEHRLTVAPYVQTLSQLPQGRKEAIETIKNSFPNYKKYTKFIFESLDMMSNEEGEPAPIQISMAEFKRYPKNQWGLVSSHSLDRHPPSIYSAPPNIQDLELWLRYAMQIAPEKIESIERIDSSEREPRILSFHTKNPSQAQTLALECHTVESDEKYPEFSLSGQIFKEINNHSIYGNISIPSFLLRKLMRKYN